jgi:hypothetical protein
MAETRAGAGGQAPRRGRRVALVTALTWARATFFSTRAVTALPRALLFFFVSFGGAFAAAFLTTTSLARTHNAMAMDEREAMDKEFEDFEKLRREADAIDPYRYRRRNRILAAIGLGALGAGLVFVIIEAVDSARNPCDRMRDYFCRVDAKSQDCQSYVGIARDSREEESKMARQAILHQCDTRIRLLKRDEGIKVP